MGHAYRFFLTVCRYFKRSCRYLNPFLCLCGSFIVFVSGCEFVLDWLHKEFWSRQLGGQLTEDWNHSEEEDEEDCVKRQEDILLSRKREIEEHSEYA